MWVRYVAILARQLFVALRTTVNQISIWSICSIQFFMYFFLSKMRRLICRLRRNDQFLVIVFIIIQLKFISYGCWFCCTLALVNKNLPPRPPATTQVSLSSWISSFWSYINQKHVATTANSDNDNEWTYSMYSIWITWLIIDLIFCVLKMHHWHWHLRHSTANSNNNPQDKPII